MKNVYSMYFKKKTNSRMDDPETHFAMSLVPMLKAIPTHQKIDVQIQILQILRILVATLDILIPTPPL